MDSVITKKLNGCLSGEIIIPPDKSISHRSLIFGSLTGGKIKISNISLGHDCVSTLKIFEKLGVETHFLSKRELILDSSKGLFSKEKNIVLDCGNSGTTARLLCGLLARSNFNCTLVGDKSLSRRPMKRIIEPLTLMGAKIKSDDNKLPLELEGTTLKPIKYTSPIASAQVKSAIMLAGLGCDGLTVIREPILSRNHSEIMLKYLGANIETGHDDEGYFVKVKKSKLIPKNIEIPGDISSAAFFMVAALIVPNSSVLIKNTGINPARAGILKVFKQAGADFKILNQRYVTNELCADISVNYTENIRPFEISGDLIPELIDEIPILSVLALKAKGKSIVKDASDLRNKESDRIKTIVDTYLKMGINIEEKEDGFVIEGKDEINAEVEADTFLDHRLAMSYYILSLINEKPVKINGFSCVNTSFPEFTDLISKLVRYE